MDFSQPDSAGANSARASPTSTFSAAEIAGYYDDWTGRYVASFGDVFQACRPERTEDLIAHLIRSADLEDGMHVLDAGSGVCGPSIRIAQQVDVTIDAVTVSAVQAEIARERIAAAGLGDRITVHHADFAQLADVCAPGRFDRALFLESLCHATVLEPVLRQCAATLKPGGLLYVKDFYRRHYADAEEERWADVVSARIEEEFRLHVRNVEVVQDACHHAGVALLDTRPMAFEPSLSEWTRFATANGLDLYAGGEPIEWVEWLELLCRRPG